MAYGKLIQYLNIRKWLTQTNHLVGVIPIGELSRINVKEPIKGDVTVDLTLKADINDRYIITGNISLSLPLECQRCLQYFDYAIDAKVDICLQAIGSQAEKDENVDDIEVDLENVPLWEIIEDEILLAMPMIAMHEDENCNQQLAKLNTQVEQDVPSTNNPFAVLKNLKTD